MRALALEDRAPSEPPPAAICPVCLSGADVRDGDPPGLCSWHHDVAGDDQWSRSNRILCDFFHRGVPPPRLPPPDRWPVIE